MSGIATSGFSNEDKMITEPRALPHPPAPTPAPTPVPTPGYKSTEFYLTLVAGIVGIYLIAIGKDEIGATLLCLSGITYSAGRSLIKR